MLTWHVPALQRVKPCATCEAGDAVCPQSLGTTWRSGNLRLSETARNLASPVFSKKQRKGALWVQKWDHGRPKKIQWLIYAIFTPLKLLFWGKITFLEPTHAWVVMKERAPPSRFPVPIVSLIIESASGGCRRM
jgi:hypothetical protein